MVMNPFQKTSLAEFSRRYLQSTEAAKPQEAGWLRSGACETRDNSFAAHVVLGMSKNSWGLQKDPAARLIG
jgi:hypothetical protein